MPLLGAVKRDPVGFRYVANCPDQPDVLRIKLMWCNRGMRLILSLLGQLVADPSAEPGEVALVRYYMVVSCQSVRL